MRTRAREGPDSSPHSLEGDYASHLRFFIDVVTRLEYRVMRARELVDEKRHGLLGRAFSRVFSLLQNADPNFDFNTAIAQCPELSGTTWRAGGMATSKSKLGSAF